ncbi:hypothetical protein QAD02_005322 [Eretmocerus hayati]|uniref:Uncharacterized protein n=1 Tax=Eretmocerus hayati TaxID=131215 RepID=A0ACC2NS80_9HYME|nr:hypothetical protein QAD02_005322 [Eretmocerus hayati]
MELAPNSFCQDVLNSPSGIRINTRDHHKDAPENLHDSTNALPDRVTSGGKKRVRGEDNWITNRRKKLRNSGEAYVSTSSKEVPAKVFHVVESCCNKNCHEKVEPGPQEKSHKHFYEDLGDYDNQNYWLSGSMQRKSTNSTAVQWSYSIRSGGFNIPVCQKFLCSLLQIKRGRLTTIQNKMLKDQSLKDCRGKHDNHKLKMTETMKNMIKLHCESIDHTGSHYTDSSLQYFVDSELNLVKLYQSFCEYYRQETQTSQVPVSLPVYSNYFNYQLNYSFSPPRTDVCDMCYEYQIAEKTSPEFEIHKENVQKHKVCKKSMLSEKDVLCLEFDFGQNLPVPKLPVNDQFYKRLLWLHVFNVNVLSDDTRSYMYFIMEGIVKKGGNTVCNFLLDSISRELALGYFNKIHMFSDSCGGQNKNYLVLFFLSVLSETFQLEIHHLFPVRGHSYCSCDRNFGLYGNKKKHMERIETPEDYYKLVEEAREPPFTIVKDSDVHLIDFESMIEEKCNIPKNLHIRDAVKIPFFPNGEVQTFEDYDSQPTICQVIDHGITLDELKSARPAPSIGISGEKLKDVRSLLRFVREENQIVLQKVLDESLVKKKKESSKDEAKPDKVKGIIFRNAGLPVVFIYL